MKPRPFIDLLIIDVINRFIFGHGVRFYCVSYRRKLRKTAPGGPQEMATRDGHKVLGVKPPVFLY